MIHNYLSYECLAATCTHTCNSDAAFCCLRLTMHRALAARKEAISQRSLERSQPVNGPMLPSPRHLIACSDALLIMPLQKVSDSRMTALSQEYSL